MKQLVFCVFFPALLFSQNKMSTVFVSLTNDYMVQDIENSSLLLENILQNESHSNSVLIKFTTNSLDTSNEPSIIKSAILDNILFDKQLTNSVLFNIDKDIDPTDNNYRNHRSIFKAFLENNTNLIRTMLNNKADLFVTNEYGMNLLYVVSDVKTALKLLLTGLNVNHINNIGSSPLHWAVSRGKKDIAQLFVEYGANVNHQDFNGNTPLHMAARQYPEMITMLIQSFGNINIYNSQGLNPFLVAREYGFEENASYLNSSSVENIQKEKKFIKPILLEARAPDKRIKVLRISVPPIIFSFFKGEYETTTKLIQQEEKIDDVKDQNGNTIFHWVVSTRNYPFVKLMFQKKADPKIKNADGLSVLDLLKEINDKQFTTYFNKLLKDSAEKK